MSLVTEQPVPNIQPSNWIFVFAGLGVGVGSVFLIIAASASKSQQKRVFSLTNLWLILSGVIHLWIEFNMVFYRASPHLRVAMDMYAAAGSYSSHNFDSAKSFITGTAAMEAITALVDGPLCIFVAFAAVHDYGCRYPLQIILCTMQLYGLVWFVLQPMFSDTGIEGHFSKDPVLFWAVAVGANAPWSIVPTILLVQSFWEVSNRLATKRS